MDWAIYGALIAAALAVGGAAAFVGIRALRTWRDVKRLRRNVARALADLAERAERTAETAERATDSSELAAAIARLRRTLARFAVLRSAVDEATDSFAGFTALYPRK